MTAPIRLPVARYDMIGLALSFPSLQNARFYRKIIIQQKSTGAPDISFEFDAVALNRWVRTFPGVTAGSLMAGRFILQVWNPQTKWTAGRFNVVEAFQRWDEAHRRAFMAWAQEPWWP